MATFPNQRTVKIHKPVYDGNFVQVSIDEWQEAYVNLTRSGFGLYLYCCGNMDGYNLELSSAAVQNALHISDSSYRRAVEELLKHGYFLKKTDTKYDFFTTPQPTTYVPKPKKAKKTPSTADAALIFDETPAAQPDDESFSNMPRSFSPDLEYSWED